MEYRKFAVGALLWGGIVLPVSNGGAETSSSDSASAQITLRIPSRAQFHPVADRHDGGELCLSHIPADNYYLSIRTIDESDSGERRMAGRSGRYCVPISASRRGRVVLIVAE